MTPTTAVLKVVFTQPLGLLWCASACLLLGVLLGRSAMTELVMVAFGFGFAAVGVWVWQLLAPPPRADGGPVT